MPSVGGQLREVCSGKTLDKALVCSGVGPHEVLSRVGLHGSPLGVGGVIVLVLQWAHGARQATALRFWLFQLWDNPSGEICTVCGIIWQC